MSGAEVIDSQAHADAVQLRNHLLIHHRQCVALRQLHHQLRQRIRRPPQLLQILDDGAIAKVAGGHVNGDMKRRTARQIRQLRHRFVDHKARQRRDKILPLGQRNKHIRRDPALARVMPAQQQLDAVALAALGVNQRLTVDHKFIGGNAVADLPAQAHAIRRRQPDDIADQQAQQQRQRQLRRQRRHRQARRRWAIERNGKRIAQRTLVVADLIL